MVRGAQESSVALAPIILHEQNEGAEGNLTPWYVLQIHSGLEQSVLKWLKLLNFTVCEFTYLRHRPRKPPIRLQIFPGYLFVSFDTGRSQWKLIPRIDGVLRLFSTAPERPTRLDDGVIEDLVLRMRTAIIEPDSPIRPSEQHAETVKLIKRMMHQDQGEIVLATNRKSKICITIFGRPVLASVDTRDKILKAID